MLKYIEKSVYSSKGIVYPIMKICLKYTQAIQLVDEFVSSLEQIWDI